MRFFLKTLLKHLALVAAGVSSGNGSAVAAGLQDIPERSIESAVEEGEELDGMRLFDEAEAILGGLVVDESSEVRRVAMMDLKAFLCELSPLRRTDLVCRWATDDDARKRLAVASALAWPLEVNGARTALDHLARDPSPDVRAAAEHARVARRAG